MRGCQGDEKVAGTEWKYEEGFKNFKEKQKKEDLKNQEFLKSTKFSITQHFCIEFWLPFNVNKNVWLLPLKHVLFFPAC